MPCDTKCGSVSFVSAAYHELSDLEYIQQNKLHNKQLHADFVYKRVCYILARKQVNASLSYRPTALNLWLRSPNPNARQAKRSTYRQPADTPDAAIIRHLTMRLNSGGIMTD